MSMLETFRNQRRALHDEAMTMINKAQSENRDLNPTEIRRYDEITADMEGLKAAIEKREDQARDERDIADSLRKLGIQSTGGPGRYGDEGGWAAQFRSAVLNRSLNPIDVRMTEPMSGVNTRSLSTSGNIGTTFYNKLVRHMVESSAILSAGATLVVTDSGEPLKIPKSTANSSAAIVAEGDTIPSSDPTLGSVTLNAYKYAFLTSITRELAEDAAFDIEGYIAAQVGDALGNGLGVHLMTGDGSGKPAGIAPAATTGVTGAAGTAGAFTADNLIDLYHSVASPYARSSSAAWFMRNATLAEVRKLKDPSTGTYLFNLDVPIGYPGAAGTLLGRPVFVDPNVAAIAADAKSVLFGDASKVWVRHVNGIRFERSLDHGFDTDTVWFKGVLRADGALVDTTGAVKAFVGGAAS